MEYGFIKYILLVLFQAKKDFQLVINVRIDHFNNEIDTFVCYCKIYLYSNKTGLKWKL